ncbi:4'-phosphopantetheinyl transferase superfamily protein [Achromobacter spanius]|uniref:4'-phosphopantetheinyl transferase family protein n=1 Tax=Achromobacter spanius TaxID=217203 RepID=UPI00320A52CC
MRDWKTSRALLQSVRHAVPAPSATSLSHSRGHAICAAAPDGWIVGADLEAIRPRNIDGLAQWVCDPAERDALEGQDADARLDLFYRMWTLKEAFVKAAGLDFPADMAAVGLAPTGAGMALRAPAGTWEACSYRLGGQWMASVVWQRPQGGAHEPLRPRWVGGSSCPLPALEFLGHLQAG